MGSDKARQAVIYNILICFLYAPVASPIKNIEVYCRLPRLEASRVTGPYCKYGIPRHSDIFFFEW